MMTTDEMLPWLPVAWFVSAIMGFLLKFINDGRKWLLRMIDR